MSLSLEALVAASAESDQVDFKREFDPSRDGDWCELLKDLLAMGNSGGGAILVGVDRTGQSVGVPPSLEKRLDPATIGDKIRKYTGGNEPRCTVHIQERGKYSVLIIIIAPVRVPVAFERAGTYQGPKAQKTAFHEGTFYFRHNTKSEPATTEDLEGVIEREISRRRDEWLGNIRRVMEAPSGFMIAVAPPSSSGIQPTARLVNDPAAPAIPYQSRDKSHPYRMTELVKTVNSRLPRGMSIKQSDVQNVRRAYSADNDPNWIDVARHGPT